jgi:hypothetical protein
MTLSVKTKGARIYASFWLFYGEKVVSIHRYSALIRNYIL